MSRITCGSIAAVARRRRPAEFFHDVLVSFLPWIVVDALHQLRPVFRLRPMNVVLQLFSSCLVVLLRRRYCNTIFATCASSGLLLPPTHAFRARGHDLTVPLVNHLSPVDEGVLQWDSRVANRGHALDQPFGLVADRCGRTYRKRSRPRPLRGHHGNGEQVNIYPSRSSAQRPPHSSRARRVSPRCVQESTAEKV